MALMLLLLCPFFALPPATTAERCCWRCWWRPPCTLSKNISWTAASSKFSRELDRCFFKSDSVELLCPCSLPGGCRGNGVGPGMAGLGPKELCVGARMGRALSDCCDGASCCWPLGASLRADLLVLECARVWGPLECDKESELGWCWLGTVVMILVWGGGSDGEVLSTLSSSGMDKTVAEDCCFSSSSVTTMVTVSRSVEGTVPYSSSASCKQNKGDGGGGGSSSSSSGCSHSNKSNDSGKNNTEVAVPTAVCTFLF